MTPPANSARHSLDNAFAIQDQNAGVNVDAVRIAALGMAVQVVQAEKIEPRVCAWKTRPHQRGPGVA